jgi:hypothetical protein
MQGLWPFLTYLYVMTIEEIHRQIDLMTRKAQRGYFSPEQKDDALHTAQMSAFMRRIGNPKEMRPGREVPVRGLGLNQKVHDDLRRFITKAKPVPVVDGMVVFPEDYVAHNALLTGAMGKVHMVSGDKLANRINSSIAPPTDKAPIATVTEEGLSVYPETLTSIKMTYLRLPKRPKFGYVAAGRGISYSAQISQDLEWPDAVQNEIMMEAIALLSIPTKDGFVLQASEMKQDKGV